MKLFKIFSVIIVYEEPKYGLTDIFKKGELAMLYDIVYILVLAALSIAMIPMALYDIKTHTIKNKFVFAILGASIPSIICDCLRPDSNWKVVLASHIAGGVLSFLLMIAVGLYVKGGLGGGDIKLIGALGLWFRVYYSLGIMAISAIAYLVYCVIIDVKFRKQGRKKPKALAFGPFVAIAVILMSIVQSILILK